ncbi:hypothetical protein ES695_09450 [Candidatus Atribacteria bacterium 1244-E10-H5-B2]|nr:MAG: hypothetical protein ES695_09450 [Candidatus Atribacteria bacterium 1244-E10-H5-B2]
MFRNSSIISPQQKVLNLSNRGSLTISSPLVFCLRALYLKKDFLKICRIMNIEKLYSASIGGKWHGRTIKYILENPLYKGLLIIRTIKLRIRN